MPETVPTAFPQNAAKTDDRKPAVSGRARNNWRHGKRARVSPLVGMAPRGYGRAVGDSRAEMNDVLALVCDQRGQTTAYDFTVALEYAEAEITRRACWRLWQRNIGKLTIEQELAIRRDATKAAEKKSACLVKLGLDALSKPIDPWESLHLPEREAQIDAGRNGDTDTSAGQLASQTTGGERC